MRIKICKNIPQIKGICGSDIQRQNVEYRPTYNMSLKLDHFLTNFLEILHEPSSVQLRMFLFNLLIML